MFTSCESESVVHGRVETLRTETHGQEHCRGYFRRLIRVAVPFGKEEEEETRKVSYLHEKIT
jgi:hypothetical protein